MRTENYYIDKEVNCMNCGKAYVPAKDFEIKEKLKVPPLFANNFCSRKCKDNVANGLAIKRIEANESK